MVKNATKNGTKMFKNGPKMIEIGTKMHANNGRNWNENVPKVINRNLKCGGKVDKKMCAPTNGQKKA
jgi:hypothetical protein